MQPYPGNQSPPMYGNPPYPQMSPPFQMPPQPQYQPGQQYVMTPGVLYTSTGAIVGPSVPPQQPKGFFYYGNSGQGFQGQEFIYAPFDDDTVRNRFISKVYSILTVQLAITAAIILIFMLIPGISIWVTKNPFTLWLALGIFTMVYFPLCCIESFRRSYPTNFIALIILTIAQSFLLAAVSCTYSTYNVLTAVGITFMICLCATVFARTTSIDFTKCWIVLFMLLIALVFMGIASMFVYMYYGRNSVFHVIYGGFGAAVFTLYLIYDTQLLIGGRTYSLNPEEYIFGTLILYIDIIMIFTYLLKLIGGEY
uniref:Uncharacterized protein n=1 Tax=Trichobilharzia regenti TaxID=157069 RepID=A0AA85KIE1_TRIRE|nr:unnamed protein product [Trichobilharzia regenti]